MVKTVRDPSLQMKVLLLLTPGETIPRRWKTIANRGQCQSKRIRNESVRSQQYHGQDQVLVSSLSSIRKSMNQKNKFKRSNGEILAVNEVPPSFLNQIFEKNANQVKTYGIVIKYHSRSGIHNMYKEYRDVTLNGAISQMCMASFLI